MARMTDSAWLRNQYGPVPAPPPPPGQKGNRELAMSLHQS